MNVLWLASWFPNRTNPTNGDFIERHAKAVAPFVKQLTIIAVNKDESLSANKVEIEKKQEGNLTIYLVYYGCNKWGGLFEKIFSYKKYLKLQHQVFDEITASSGLPDIIHVQVAMKAGIYARKIKKKYSIPYVITEHWSGYFMESKPNIYDMGTIYKRLNNAVLKNASLLLPVAKHLATAITDNFVKLPCAVVPNVVNTELFFYKPYSPDVFTFIHPSYMNYPKNPEGILQGCLLLKQRGYPFRLYMIGKRPPELIALAEQYGLLDEFVFFENEISYSAVASRMQQSSALLMFSRYENLPCIMLEALCCGLPVVSSNVGGIAGIINSSNGLLVDKDNTGQLAEAMKKMIDDYSTYNRAAIAATAAAAFSYNVVGKQIKDLYQQVIQKKKDSFILIKK
jgi:glycosyltransferase involved in cell wall biosynthesis